MDLQKPGSTQEWLDARKALLLREKALTRERDELSALRREMPLLQVEESYNFQSEEGRQTLRQLFGPHRQLIIYHFMFGADWQEGCPSCSFWADNFDGIDVHLAARDTAFACVSNAPLDKLLAYRKRLGWRFKWVSAKDTDFSANFAVSFHDGDQGRSATGYNYSGTFAADELPGVSVFIREGDTVFHSYSTYSRGLDMLNGAYQFLDLTPLGRQEEDLDWPMAWLKRRDVYV